MRRLAHRFHPAGKHDRRLAKLDQLRSGNDGLNAGAAQSIYGQRRNFDRQSGLEGDVPRAVQRVAARLKRIAEDGVIEFAGLQFRIARWPPSAAIAPSSIARAVAQRAAIFAHRRALAGDDDNFFHLKIISPQNRC